MKKLERRTKEDLGLMKYSTCISKTRIACGPAGCLDACTNLKAYEKIG